MRTVVALSVLATASSAFVFPDTSFFRKPELQAQRVVTSTTRQTFEYISHCMQTAADYSKETLEEIFGAEERELEGSGGGGGHHPPPPPPPPHHPPRPPHHRPRPPPRKPEDPGHKPGGGPGKKPGKGPGKKPDQPNKPDQPSQPQPSQPSNPGYPGDGTSPGYPGSPEQPYLPPNSTNSTIWDLISNGKYTTKFYKLASKYESVISILNSTSANFTLFVPSDDHFYFPGSSDDDSGNDKDKNKKSSSSDKNKGGNDKNKGGNDKNKGGNDKNKGGNDKNKDGNDKNKDGSDNDSSGPSSEFIEDTLLYHIAYGRYLASDLLHMHTLTSAYNESWLGGRPQRLRNRVGLFGGVRQNFFSRVIGANVRAKNGVVHVINAPLFPPPPAAKIISLIPERFDSFVQALNQTSFVDYFQELALNGSTIFAPTNHAFDRMGSKTKAFLLKSGKKNRKYLKALLKYHVVANNTLYTDMFYQERNKDKGGRKGRNGGNGNGGRKKKHGSAEEELMQEVLPGYADKPRNYKVSLPTLLGRNTSVSVNVDNLGGWRRVEVNGYVPVTVTDVIAKEGVIHVVARVLVPPKKNKSFVEGEDEVDDEISVEELKERLEDYLEDDDESTDGEDEWDNDL